MVSHLQGLLSDKEFSELPNNSPNIFKKTNVDCYAERPNAKLWNEKYKILNDFCYV